MIWYDWYGWYDWSRLVKGTFFFCDGYPWFQGFCGSLRICEHFDRRGGKSISKVVAKQEFERKRTEEQWMLVSLRLGVHLFFGIGTCTLTTRTRLRVSSTKLLEAEPEDVGKVQGLEMANQVDCGGGIKFGWTSRLRMMTWKIFILNTKLWIGRELFVGRRVRLVMDLSLGKPNPGFQGQEKEFQSRTPKRIPEHDYIRRTFWLSFLFWC